MNGFIQTEFACRQRCRRQHTHGTSQHGCLIGKNVAKHVLGYDHIKTCRVGNEVHGSGVHQDVLVGQVLKLGLHNLFGDLAPQSRCGHDIGLVNHGQFSTTLPGNITGHSDNALDFLT